MHLVACQEDGKKTALGISDCMDLRVAFAFRPTGRLTVLAPFSPGAGQWALICVRSTISIAVDLPRPTTTIRLTERISQIKELCILLLGGGETWTVRDAYHKESNVQFELEIYHPYT